MCVCVYVCSLCACVGQRARNEEEWQKNKNRESCAATENGKISTTKKRDEMGGALASLRIFEGMDV